MSDETATGNTGPIEEPKPRRGRPPKNARKDPRDAEIARLKAALKAAQSEEVKEVVLAPELIAKRKPGEYMTVGADKSGNPEIRKRPWIRGDFDQYPKVEYTPHYSGPCVVQGVRFELVAGQQTTVPSVVKDEFERAMRIQHPDYATMYPEPTMDQIQKINQRAKATGKNSWSNVHFIGTGHAEPTPDW